MRTRQTGAKDFYIRGTIVNWCSYRIDRFDKAINHWSIVRFAIADIASALAEMQAMRTENPNFQLRIIKIEATIVEVLP